MKTFEGKVIKSDYGDCKPDWHWWISDSEHNTDDGEFLMRELKNIGEGKRVRIIIEEI